MRSRAMYNYKNCNNALSLENGDFVWTVVPNIQPPLWSLWKWNYRQVYLIHSMEHFNDVKNVAINLSVFGWLMDHLWKVHLISWPMCDNCENELVTSGLKLSMRILCMKHSFQNSGLMNIECEMCEKRFKFHSNLKNHHIKLMQKLRGLCSPVWKLWQQNFQALDGW